MDLSANGNQDSKSIAVGYGQSDWNKHRFVLSALKIDGSVDNSFVSEKSGVLINTEVTFDEEQTDDKGKALKSISHTVAVPFGPTEAGTVGMDSLKAVYTSAQLVSKTLLYTKTGTVTFTATYTSGSTFTAKATIKLTAAVAQSLGFAAASSTSVVNKNIEVSVSARDQFGNIATSYNTQAGKEEILSANGTAVTFQSKLKLTSGAQKLNVKATTAQLVRFTLKGGTLFVKGDTVDILFTAGPTAAYRFVTPNFPSIVVGKTKTYYRNTAGSIPLTLTAVDAFGNLAVAEDKQIGIVVPKGTIISNLAPAVGGISSVVKFTAGVANFGVTVAKAQGVLVALQKVLANQNADFSSNLALRFTELCDGVNNYQDVPGTIACKTTEGICVAGSKQIQAPNTTANRICQSCDGKTEFQEKAGQTFCHVMGPKCLKGTGEVLHPSNTTNRTCGACDGVSNYQNLDDQPSCKNVTVCQDGQDFAAESTPISDRMCKDCAPGFADLDNNPYTACTPCNPTGLSVAAPIVHSQVSGAVEMSESNATGLTVTISYRSIGGTGSLPAWITDVQLSSTQCVAKKPDNSDLVRLALTDPLSPDASARGTVAYSSSSNLPLALEGKDTAWGRGVYYTIEYVSNATGTPQLAFAHSCQDLNAWAETPTYTDKVRQTVCQNVTSCQAGTAVDVAYTRKNDRTCKACSGTTGYQDQADKRFCNAVTTCDVSPGFREKTPPQAATDRVCEPVTCQGLDAPDYGSITAPCSNSSNLEAFNSVCRYSCNVAKFFSLELNAGWFKDVRRCGQDGKFDGIAPKCVCKNGLILDAVNQECVSKCPTGLYKTGSTCTKCAAQCQQGSYESTPCAALTNRVCTTCSTCAAGTWGSAGCNPLTNNDTICTPHQECPPGQLEETAGTPTSNRKCKDCFRCPSSDFASTGCCGKADTICTRLSTCNTGEFSTVPPTAIQGGFKTDRVCQKLSQCGTGQFYSQLGDRNTDNACTTCTTCPFGSYATKACVQGSGSLKGSDTVCTPWKKCATDNYLAQPGSPFEDGSCGPCSKCQTTEYRSGGCNNTVDTVCTARRICDANTEYESIPNPKMDAATVAVTDRVCTNCTNCEAKGDVTTGVCSAHLDATCTPKAKTSNTTLYCPRGTVAIGSHPNHACIACKPCASGSYAKGGLSCLNPVLTFNDPTCEPWSVCTVGSFEAVSPTPETDRVCQTCSTCPNGQYRDGGCQGATDTLCIKERPCQVNNSYEVVAGTAVAPHQCKKCRNCNYIPPTPQSDYLAQGEYVSSACTETTDTVCSKFHSCPTDTVVISRGSPTQDRACLKCPGILEGRSFSTRSLPAHFMCPPTIADQCPAPLDQTTPAPALPIYRSVTVQLQLAGNTLAGVAFGKERTAQFESALASCIGTFLNSSVDGLKITASDNAGVSLDFDLTKGEPVDTPANFTDASLQPLTCPYEDVTMTYMNNSLKAQLMTTSTTTTTITATTKTTTLAPTPAPTPPPTNAPTFSRVVDVTFADLDFDTANQTALDEYVRSYLRDEVNITNWATIPIAYKKGSVIASITTDNKATADSIQASIPDLQSKVSIRFAPTTTPVATTQAATAGPADDSGLGGGAIAGILIGVIVAIGAIFAAAYYYKKSQNEVDEGRSFQRSGSITSLTTPSESGYLGVGATEENSIFSNQVAEENRKLRDEVAVMQEKIALKDAGGHHQQLSQKAAQSKFEKAIAARISKENSQLAGEIKAMQSEIKKMKNQTAYQKAASEQVKLLAVKTQLEEEITRVNEIEQVALSAIEEFDQSLEGDNV